MNFKLAHRKPFGVAVRKRDLAVRTGLTAVAAVLVLASSTLAQSTEKVLQNLTTGAGGGLVARGGNLYGTTAGFNKQYGTIFELTPQKNGTWIFKLLYKFTGGADGAYPQPGLVFDKSGNLYGTTQVGGVNSCDWTVPNTCGAVFELSPTVTGLWNEKVLYSFPGGGGPAIPNTGLISDSSGNFYGATNVGGTHFDDGTVFKLTQQQDGTWTEQQLYAFSSSYGISVKGLLTLDSAGNLYGTTLDGGNGSSCSDSSGCGTIFELSPVPTGSWMYSLLYTFCSLANCADGGYPNGDLLDVGGNLYGTTSSGAVDFTNGGTAFELVRTGVGKWTYDLLYTFCSLPSCADGSRPSGGLIRNASGNLYGPTVVGGMFLNGVAGTVFKLSPGSGGTWSLTSLYDFCQSQNCPDGSEPAGRLTLDKVGNVYGTTSVGGSKDTGVAFQIIP